MVRTAKKATPEALKLKTCKKKVKKVQGGKMVIVECGRQYLKDYCPDKDMHMLSMVTGFCSNGWCEGTKSKDWRGRPAPTCSFIHTCPCKCHASLDQLFAMTGKERLVVDSSGYVSERHEFLMPEDPIRDAEPDLSMVDPTPAPVGVQDPPSAPVAPVVPPPVARTFGPTNSGRTAKGQLEAWVKIECDAWLIDKPGFPATPQYISNEIARAQGVAPPSVGAIDAVYKRWEALGFARIEKKPTRFIGYTEEGVQLGLERIKERAKRQKKLKVADDRRNLRR